jgi:prolyl-tRNA synthetase
VKTIIYEVDGRPVAALVRGDREINEAKLGIALAADAVKPAEPSLIERLTHAPVGFAGPVGLASVEIIADHSVEPLVNMVVGGNKKDVHLRNVNLGRDFTPSSFRDIVLIGKGDRCARCGGTLDAFRGIEVSQAFKLGTKYSTSMKATYLAEDGAAKPFIMGCYGLGVSRTVAAIVEQHNDKDGIAWPAAVAPYALIITVVNVKNDECRRAADRLYEEITARSIEVLYDDRDESPGVKFKDADLVGIPLRVTVGERGLKRGAFEARVRRTGAQVDVPIATATDDIVAMLKTVR